MRPVRHLTVALALLALGALAPACAAGATWQFAPAEAPPAPPGVAQQPLPVPLGKVGAISFWAPNRGLLIEEGTSAEGCRTANGTAGVPCGLYAYNGRSWHLLSTVCGAGEGRIAWAGPEDFWTISDRRPNFITKNPPPNPRERLPLPLPRREGGGLLRDTVRTDQLLPADGCGGVPRRRRLLVRRLVGRSAGGGLPIALGRAQPDGPLLAHRPRGLIDGAHGS